MKKILASILAIATVATFFAFGSSAAKPKYDQVDDIDFKDYNHITPVSVSAKYAKDPRQDNYNPAAIFDNNVESVWYENQLKASDNENTDPEWVPGTVITAKFDKVYEIAGIRTCTGDYFNRARVDGVKVTLYKNGATVASIGEISFNRGYDDTNHQTLHTVEYFKLKTPTDADEVRIELTEVDITGALWWSSAWAHLADFSFFTPDDVSVLETEFYTDSSFAFGVDTTFGNGEYLPYILPKSVTSTVSSKGEDPMDAFYDSLIYIKPDSDTYSEDYWSQPIKDKLATFTVKYDKAYEIRGFDIIPGIATWAMGGDYCNSGAAKPTSLEVTFKKAGAKIDSTVIYLDWDRSSSAAYDNYSYQLPQYYVLNRTVVADELEVKLLDNSAYYHDDLDGSDNNAKNYFGTVKLLGLTRFGAIGVSGETPTYWINNKSYQRNNNPKPTEAPTSASPEDPTEIPTEAGSDENPSDLPTEDISEFASENSSEEATGEAIISTENSSSSENATQAGTESSSTEPGKDGCGSAVLSTAAVITMACAAAVILKKKED